MKIKSSALELTRLRQRIIIAINNDKRARKGSDKTYRRECKQEIENIRNLIGNILRGENE